MNIKAQKTILISAVGFSDPFFVVNDTRYGPLLSIALKYKPDIIYLIITKEIDVGGRKEAVIRELEYYLPNTELKIMSNNIFSNNPAETKDVFIFLKPALQELNCHKNDIVLINFSSGTPQLSNILRLVGKHMFNDLKVIQVLRVKELEKRDNAIWNNYKVNVSVAHKDEYFFNDVKEINLSEEDINYYTFISSVKILIDTYDYYAAYELSNKMVADPNQYCFTNSRFTVFLNLLLGSFFLRELNIIDAKQYFKDANILPEINNITRVLAAIKVAEIYIKKKNINESIKAIAIFREQIIEHLFSKLINKDKKYFEKTSDRKIKIALNTLKDFLISEGVEFLDLEESIVGNSGWLLMQILRFIVVKEKLYADLGCLLLETHITLTKKRNSISHDFKSCNEVDFDNAVSIYKELIPIAEKYNLIPVERIELFDLLNERIKNYLMSL